jgi:feruloyl esterase
VCAYPDEAVYKGSGNINDAANFSCQTAKGPDRTVTASDLVNVRNALTQRNLELPNR